MLGVFTDDYFPYIGGMGRYVYEVVSRLPQDRLTVFSPSRNDFPYHHPVAPALHNQLRNISYSYWLNRNVGSLVNSCNLDRINIQCGPGGLFLWHKPPVPVIATCYHTWWQQSHYIPSQFWKKIFIPFEIRTYRLADRIICISEDSRNILVEKYKIPARKTVIITPGVDSGYFSPMPGVEKIPESILYIGRVDKRKGVDFLIRAMTEVVARLPAAMLFVGGRGKDLESLKSYSKAHGLEKNIQFLGFIPDEKLNLWYNKVQCVVIPSVFEGFGLTAVEAMAAGTSVVCTAVDSLKTIVEDGVCGSLVEYGDCNDLSTKIVSLLTDKELRKRFSRAGRDRVLSLYDWDSIVKRLRIELLDN